MKNPRLFCLLLFAAVIAFSCSRDPIGEPAPPPEQGHSHHAEAEWDEEFWQELQGDPVFQELREVVDYRNLCRIKDQIADGNELSEEYSIQFRGCLNFSTLALFCSFCPIFYPRLVT